MRCWRTWDSGRSCWGFSDMATRNLTQLQRQIFREIRQIEDDFVSQIMLNYKYALDDTRLILGKLYEKYSKAGVLTYAEMSKFNRLEKLYAQLSDLLGPTFSVNGNLVENLCKVQYEEAFYRSAWAIDQVAEASLRWGFLSPETVKAAVRTPEWRRLHNVAITTWKRDTFAKLDRTITQGLIQGQSYGEMAKALKEGVFEKSASSAERIARTEGHRAAIQGKLHQIDEAERLGIEVLRIWDATLDRATRPEHGELDGQPANKEGFFNTSFGLVQGPGLSGIPEQDINCRCVVREQIEGYEPKVRRIRDEGIVEYKTYNEWVKDKGIKTEIMKKRYDNLRRMRTRLKQAA